MDGNWCDGSLSERFPSGNEEVFHEQASPQLV